MEKFLKFVEKYLPFVGIVFLGLMFLPLYAGESEPLSLLSKDFYKFVPLVTFLLPVVGVAIMPLHNKLKDIELLSILMCVTSVVLMFALRDTYGQFKIGSNFIVVVDIIVALLLFFILNSKNQYKIRDIVEAAMLIALAVALDLPGAKIRVGASGGSISFTMVPLVILALRQGPAKGFIGAGVIYGLITCIFDGWGMASYPFDYLLAYGSLCVLGFFRNLIFPKDKETRKGYKILISLGFLTLGTVLAVVARWGFATLSGVILWETPFKESLIYNATYVLPSGGITLAVLLILFKPLQYIEYNIVGKRYEELKDDEDAH